MGTCSQIIAKSFLTRINAEHLLCARRTCPLGSHWPKGHKQLSTMNFARRLIRIPGHDEVTAEDEHQEANDLAYHVANQIEQELRAQYELRSEDDSHWA